MTDMEVTLTDFEMACYDGVMTLWRQCEGIGLSGADSIENIQAYLERNPGMSFVAKAGEEVIGAVLAGHDGRRGYIHHLAVRPDCRRQGVGRQLVDECLQALGTLGIQKCHLFIFEDNATGTAFWEAIGWFQRPELGVISKLI